VAGAWHKTLDGKYLCYDCTPAGEREKVERIAKERSGHVRRD
jgi:hypothetical protein